MRLYRFLHQKFLALFILLLLCSTSQMARTQIRLSAAELHSDVRKAQVTPLTNGIDVQGADLRHRIIALREDVLRITMAHGSTLPEDASWAVLPSARSSRVPVVMDAGSDRIGFHTHALSVEVDSKTLQIKVRNSAGNILQGDARPIRFDGDAFRIYKSMPLDEHYFGLGDKTGPLDRRNQAFTLWNTDAYRFQ